MTNTEHRTRTQKGRANALRAVFCVLCSLFVISCFNPAAPGPVDRQFTLGPGQSATVSEAGVSIKFVTITGDNRCPADAICITGGSADVRIEVRRGNSTEPHDLKTGDMKPVVSKDVTIELVEVSPYPFSSSPIQPGDYRVTLRVKR